MKRIEYNGFAGVKINGDTPMEPPGPRHIDAASWLTAAVESGGKFGTVISYDGTGMTAGIHQAIAVYPKELASPDDGNNLDDQGPLWKLLHRIFQTHPDLGVCRDLQTTLMMNRIKVVNGIALDSVTGEPCSGRTIRRILTGSSDGIMPVAGADRYRAEMFAALFHAFFSDISTFPIQLAWGENHLLDRLEKTPLRFCKAVPKNTVVQDIVYSKKHPGIIYRSELDPPFDLAMCVWLSFTVNAPAIALKKICKALDILAEKPETDFPALLIRLLGNSTWGRWDDDIKNGRYQRTRKYAMEIWPEELFVGPDAIMPKNLEG